VAYPDSPMATLDPALYFRLHTIASTVYMTPVHGDQAV
jgi:hypothetical protein